LTSVALFIVDVNDIALAVWIEEEWVVLGGLIAQRDDQVTCGQQLVSRLISEETNTSVEEMQQFTRYGSSSLERFQNRDPVFP